MLRTVVLALTPSPSPKGRGAGGEGFRVRENSGFQVRRGLAEYSWDADVGIGFSNSVLFEWHGSIVSAGLLVDCVG